MSCLLPEQLTEDLLSSAAVGRTLVTLGHHGKLSSESVKPVSISDALRSYQEPTPHGPVRRPGDSFRNLEKSSDRIPPP